MKYNNVGFSSSHPYPNGNFELDFSDHELFHAAYTVGKASWEEVNQHPNYSEHEKNFRISMIQAFLSMEDVYIKKSTIFITLDPSEKVAINYFFGIVFCNLVLQKNFEVRWLLHLDLFKGQIKLANGKKRPDFIGRKINSSWNAIEAKGVQLKKEKTLINAEIQLKNLLSIDGTLPDYKLISILYGVGENDLTLDVIDPENEGSIELVVNDLNYARDYYAEIYFIVKKDFIIKEIQGRKFAVRNLACHQIFLGLDLFVFKEIQLVNSSEITREIESYLKKYDEKEGDRSDKKDFFIGRDGVYVSSYKNKPQVSVDGT